MFCVDGTYLMDGLRQIPRNAISEVHAYCILTYSNVTCIIDKLLNAT